MDEILESASSRIINDTNSGLKTVPSNIFVAAANLSARAYSDSHHKSQSVINAVNEGIQNWTALEPKDLGLSITATDGSTALIIGNGNGSLLRYDHLNASASIGLITLDGKRTLGIAFEGTNDLTTANGQRDFEQDILFIKGYYDSLSVLTSAVAAYVKNHNNIDQVLVAGHSLGGAAAQSFMHEFGQDDIRYIGVTFGSPGTIPSESVAAERFVNIQHSGDAVVVAARVASENIVNGSVINVDVNFPRGNDILVEHTLFNPLDNASPSYSKTVEFITNELDANIMFRDMNIVSGTNADDNLITNTGKSGEVLLGGNGSDTIISNLANQILMGGRGDDILEGGLGVDTAIYTGPRSNYVHNKLDENFLLSDQRTGPNNDGTDTLNNIERIIFIDSALALDVDGSAGTVAKLIGAVFGAESVTNANLVAIGLSEIDKGTSNEELAALAIGTSGADSPEQVTSLLWNNVVGSLPTKDQAQPYIDMLNAGTSTGALGVFAAEHSLNAANIDLVGLKESGIVFDPQVYFG